MEAVRSWTTILVPKSGDLREPANWRPLTIGSAVQRLMHRVIVRRLNNTVSLQHHQRVFTDADDTLANVTILDHYIRSRRGVGKSFKVVSCEKAFDSISHYSIDRALTRHSVHPEVVKYIMTTLTTSTTKIAVGSQSTSPIRITRGVKQGDPIRPVLFNLVTDEVGR